MDKYNPFSYFFLNLCINYMNYPKARMTAIDVLDIQLRGMKNNDINNSGIKVAYFFASPANRSSTGPLNNFINMVKNDIYKHLLNCKSYKILETRFSNYKKNFSAKVKIKSSFDSKFHYYIFELSKQNMMDKEFKLYLNNYYRTNSVIKIS